MTWEENGREGEGGGGRGRKKKKLTVMQNKLKWQRRLDDIVHELLHRLPWTRLVACKERRVGEQGACGHETA